jgi:hypothetical protein
MSSNQVGAMIMSGLVTIAFLVACILLAFLPMNFSDISGKAFLLLTGMLSQAFGTAVNYWLGSSANSKGA